MVDNVSMEDITQVTQNTMELTAPPAKVTTHTHNIMDTNTKKHYEYENGGERGDDDGYDSIALTENLGLGCASRYVESSSSSLPGKTDGTPPRPPAR